MISTLLLSNNLFFTSLIAICIGIVYGSILYFQKMYSLQNNNPITDIIFTFMRYGVLLSILYGIIIFVEHNSILLIILFVSSYLSTVAVLVYKA